MGSYVVSVSFRTGCYRHIQVDSDATLLQLHSLIANAFSLTENCSHAFFLDNRFWGKDAYVIPQFHSSDKLTKDCRLSDLQLPPGREFKYIYNLGCEMRFQCRILIAPHRKKDFSGVLRTVGDTPEAILLADDERRGNGPVSAESKQGNPSIKSPAEDIEYPFAYLSMAEKAAPIVRGYLNAAANLYGILSLQELLNIYNSQNTVLTESVFLAAIILVLGQGREANGFTFVRPRMLSPASDHPAQGIYLSAVKTAEKRRFHTLLRSQEGKPLQVLPKDAFLLYANPFYFPETAERENMLAYLGSLICLTEKEAVSCCNDIQLELVQDCTTELILQIVRDRNLPADKNWNDWSFLRILQALSDHTHRYKNRGFSPDEFRMISQRDGKFGIEGQLSLFDGEK